MGKAIWRRGSISVPSSSGSRARLPGTLKLGIDSGFQSPLHRGAARGFKGFALFVGHLRFSPLFIGEPRAACSGRCERWMTTRFSPLFIGEPRAAAVVDESVCGD